MGRTPYTDMTEFGGSGKGMRSWFDGFCEKAPVDKETALETFIVSFLFHPASWSVPFHEPDCCIRQQYLEMWRDPGRGKPFPVQDDLIQLRLTSMTTAIAVDRDKTGAGPDSISNLPALMCSRPIDYVLAILDRTMPGLAQKCDDFAPWAHKFLHKFLLHAAMSIADIEHRSVKYDTYLIWMREDLEQIYFKDIRRTHPHLFQQAFEALDMFPDRRVCRKNLRRG